MKKRTWCLRWSKLNFSTTVSVDRLILNDHQVIGENWKEFGPHVSLLRKKAISIIIVFAFSFLFGFIFFNNIISIFLDFFAVPRVTVVLSSPFEVFNLAVNSGLFLGIILTTPFAMFQFLSFSLPAIPLKDRYKLLPIMFTSLVLLVSGFIFGALLMKSVVFEFSQAISSNINNYWNISLFLSQVLLTAACMGLIFQFPLILACMVKLGLVKVEGLKRSRPLIIIGIFVFTALLPPTDPLSLLLMVAPILLFFEITLFILSRKKEVKKNVR